MLTQLLANCIHGGLLENMIVDARHTLDALQPYITLCQGGKSVMLVDENGRYLDFDNRADKPRMLKHTGLINGWSVFHN